MKIYMTTESANRLGKFLNRKFARRVEEAGHGFTMSEFAIEVGLKRSTLTRLMNEKTQVKGITLDHLRLLIKKFGRELLDELDLNPPEEKTP